MSKMNKSERQYRSLESFTLQPNKQRIESDFYIEGYATKWAPYPLFENSDGTIIYEEFTREAFARTDMKDVILQFEHRGKVFARKSNKTLIVEPDETGLFIAADLSKTEEARKLYEEIKAGMITKMSWGFKPGIYKFDKASNTIKHTSIKKIYDVSAVSLPANDDTEIQARSFGDGVITKAIQELENSKITKIGLKIKTIIGGEE